MTGAIAERKQRKSLSQHWQRWVQTRVWHMDIHPTAWIATSALIDRTWPRGIHIGAACIIDEQAVILTHDLTRGVYLDTRIGAGTVVGARAIVLPGITVGEGCVLAPGTLVNRDVPAGAFVEGNPGKIVERQGASAVPSPASSAPAASL